MFRTLVLRTCFIGRFFIVLIFVSGLVARASHFALFGGCFAHFNVIPGLTGYLVLCLWRFGLCI